MVNTLAGSRASGIVPVNCVALRLVKPLPSPVKLPAKVNPVALFVTTLAGSCVGVSVPAMLAAATLPALAATEALPAKMA